MQLLPLIFNIVLGVLAREIKHRKIKQSNGNGISKINFTDDMISYVENSKDSTKILSEIINLAMLQNVKSTQSLIHFCPVA